MSGRGGTMRQARADTRPQKKIAFLEAYRQTGRMIDGCKAINVTYETIYRWGREDPQFQADIVACKPIAAQLLKDEGMRRAREGWEEPVYQQGSLVGTVRKYSDTLLIFLLKGLEPETYRERYDVQSKNEHKIVKNKAEELSDDELAAIVLEARKKKEK